MIKQLGLKDTKEILEHIRKYAKVLLMNLQEDGSNLSDWLKANGKKIRNFVCVENNNVGILDGIVVKSIDSLTSWNKEALLIYLEQDIDEKGELEYVQELGFENILVLKKDFVREVSKNPIYKENNDLYEKKLLSIAKNKERDDEVKVLFLTPPSWDIYTPFGAVPCLAAALNMDNIASEQIDMGILCFHTKLKRVWKDYAKSFLNEEFYRKTVQQYVKNPYEQYEEYIEGLWFFNCEEFPIEEIKQKYYTLNRVQIGVLDIFFQNIANSLSVNVDFNLEEDIEKIYNKYDKNILIDAVIEMGLENQIVNAPSVVGISITGTNQFLPGCALAKMIKYYNPNTKIIVGGSALDVFLASQYKKKQDILDYFDYIISGEGETAIRKLVKALLEGKEVNNEEIPNLVHFTKEGELVLPEVFLEDVNTLPVPCFDGIDFELYLAPEPMIPYQASRGCHYGYCAFCNHNSKYRHNYRVKKGSKVVSDLISIKKKYKINYFQFVDEAIRPDCFEEMVTEMDRNEHFRDTKWIFYSRVSYQYKEELLEKAKRNGCEMVMFGVETFNQRLLNFIKKGISAETSKYCIKLFSKAGIKTFIWLMCNLPSETVEEMRGDIATVKEYMPYLAGMAIGPFYLDVNTDMHRNMEMFNIVKYNPYDGTRFESTNDGVVIDKEEMFEVYGREYAVLPKQHFFTTNRYTIFYDELKARNSSNET